MYLELYFKYFLVGYLYLYSKYFWKVFYPSLLIPLIDVKVQF